MNRKLQVAKKHARKLLEVMPIVGHLSRCTMDHHKSSFREFAITILFGTATFWLTAIFLRAFLDNKDLGPFELLHKTVSSGQLFIFAVGMLGPILLSSAEDPKNSKQFPGRTDHFALILLTGALAAGFYALVLAGREHSAASMFDTNFLFYSSVVIAIVVVVLRYLTIVYRRSTLHFDTEERLLGPVEQFADDFSDRHPSSAVPSPEVGADEMASRFNSRGAQE